MQGLYHQVTSCPADVHVYAAASISYNFVGSILSVFVGGAVLPIAFALFWSGCTALGACAGTLTGGCCGLIAWCVTSKKMYEEITVLSLQNNEPLLAGCCVGVGIAAIVCSLLVSHRDLMEAATDLSWSRHGCMSCKA